MSDDPVAGGVCPIEGCGEPVAGNRRVFCSNPSHNATRLQTQRRKQAREAARKAAEAVADVEALAADPDRALRQLLAATTIAGRRSLEALEVAGASLDTAFGRLAEWEDPGRVQQALDEAAAQRAGAAVERNQALAERDLAEAAAEQARKAALAAAERAEQAEAAAEQARAGEETARERADQARRGEARAVAGRERAEAQRETTLAANKDLRERNQALAAQIADLRSDIAEVRTHNTALRTQLADTGERLTGAEAAADQARQAERDIAGQLAGRDTELLTAHTELDRLRAEVGQAHEQLGQTRGLLTAAEHTNSELKTDNHHLRQRVENLLEQLAQRRPDR